MKQMKERPVLRRIVPLILAVVVLAGTLLGLFSSVVNAEDDTGDAVKPDLYVKLHSQSLENKRGDPAYSYDLEHYILKIELKVLKSDFPDPKNSHPQVNLIKNNNFRFDNPNNGELDPYFEYIRPVTLQEKEDSDPDYLRLLYEYDGITFIKSPTKGVRPKFTVSYPGYKNEPLDGWTLYAASINTDDDDSSTTKGSNSTSSETEVITTPKMIVTDYQIPDIVNPGEEFTVTIEFMNNSKKKSMENVSMTVTPPEGAVIKNGMNKRHYITIPRRQSTSETFTFKASDNLKSEAIAITVKFDYQYELDNAYKDGSSEEILSISSIPKEEEKEEKKEGTEGSISSFEILSVIPPDSMFPGEDGYLTVKVINKDHQYDASNVQLTVTGDGLVNNGNTEYHGALAHSSQAEIEMPIQFSEPGTYTLEAIVTYEDAEGKDKDNKPIVRINDLKKEFTVTVDAAPEIPGMDDMGMAGMDGVLLDENGMPVGGEGAEAPWFKRPPVLIGCGAGALVLIVVIAVIVKKVKAKKAGDADEDI